jgi:hypothetical protein
MKIDNWINLVDTEDITSTPEFALTRGHLETAIEAVKWPIGSPDFRINPVKKGNGVKPIKTAFVQKLRDEQWRAEVDDFDVYKDFGGQSLPFVAEWETGNVSSSHRAVNRIALGNLEQRISGGVLVLPNADLYPYLTDRVGNLRELLPYLPLWEQWQNLPNFGYFGIVSVTFDGLDDSVPLIRKGTDGRALV